MKIQVTTAAISDIGKVRKANEDSFFVSENEDLLIVCDGMGGQIAGGLASKMAVETIKDVFYGLNKQQIVSLFDDIDPNLPASTLKLIAAVRIANRRIFRQAASFPKLRGMGTTVVTLTFDKSLATMVHVGDSRILRISRGKILQLTEDHSWLNELIEDNEINEEQIETFSQKNVITRALGTSPAVKIDIHCEKYQSGDVYVLCTDGLHNSVGSEDINKIFQKRKAPLDAITKKLVDQAKARDGSDNITVAVARIKQDCGASKQGGFSTTIVEESEKILAKEDKYIHGKYLDPKINRINKTQVTGMNPQKLTVIGSFLLTAVVCFLLGMNLQAKKRGVLAVSRPLPAANGQVTTGRPNRGNTVPKSNAAEARKKEPRHINLIPGIGKSKLSKDAVLAFVFFNSAEDYRKARLEERGAVLDKLHPYAVEENTQIRGDFSIFLIDSSNNVIRKTSGMKLPNYENPNAL